MSARPFDGNSAGLARMLVRAEAEAASGVARAERGKLRRVFCVREGWLVFAASNLVEEQYLETLVQAGAISARERVELEREASSRGLKPLGLLRERESPSPEVLAETMESLIGSLLSSCLEWPDGRVTLEQGQPRLEDEVTVHLSPLALVLRHARRYPASLDAVRGRLGAPDQRLVVATALRAMPRSAALGDVEREMIERFEETATVAEVLAAVEDRAHEALRALYGLVLAGILERATEAKHGSVGSSLSREEAIARFAAAASDHYAVLGLDRSADPDQVRQAYYALARRFHPDRFRSEPLADLASEAEAFFSQVTEAYNTLGSSASREAYDRALVSQVRESEEAKTADATYIARQNYLRGRALMERHRFAEAASFLENAARFDDSRAEYHLALGLVLARSASRREGAERHLTRALELDPSRGQAYVALARLYARSARKADAVRLLRDALRWDATNTEATALLAELDGRGTPDDRGILRGLFKG